MDKTPNESDIRIELLKLQSTDHLCSIYKSEKEKFDTLIPFIHLGLSKNEKCVCIVNEETKNQIIKEIKIIENEESEDFSEHIEFLTSETIFHEEGSFNPKRIINLLTFISDKSESETYMGLRIVSDISWILTKKGGKKLLNEYETKLDDFCISKDAVSLCLYNESEVEYRILGNVILNHSKIVINNTLCNNTLYNEADFFSSKSEKQLSKELLRSISKHIVSREENERVFDYIKEEARKELEEQKKLSEKLYKTLFETSGTANILVDQNGYIKLVNSKTEELLGLPKEVLEDRRKWTYIIPKLEAEKLVDRYRNKIIKSEKFPTQYETRIKNINGDIKTVILNAGIIPNSTDIIVSVIDITDMKNVEKELENSKLDLGERVKELSVIFNISKYLIETKKIVNEALQDSVQFIPDAYQYTDIAKARISYGEQHFVTEGFMETEWKQSTNLVQNEQRIGSLEVYYIEEKPEEDEGPFLKEERDLIEEIARLISGFITRKNAEKALLLHKHALDSSLSAIAISDLDDNLIYVNPALIQLWDYENHEEIFSKNVNELMLETQPDNSLLEHSREIHQSHGKFDGEVKAHKPDGTPMWIQMSSSLIKDFDNNPIANQVSFIDITEKKIVEEALKESEEKYRTLIETSPDAVLLIDLDGKIIYANKQTAKLLGYEDVDEILKDKRLSNGFVHFAEDYLEIAQSNMQKTIKIGNVEDFEYVLVKKDGSNFSAEISTTLMRNNEGEPYAMMVVGREISERKKSEDALIKSEERYRKVVEKSPIGIITSSLDGKIITSNSSAAILFGYNSPESFITEVNKVGIGEKLYITPEKRNLFLESVSKANDWYIDEIQFIRKDGAVVTLLLRSHFTTDTNDEQVIESYFEDITEKKKNELERIKATEALKQSEEKLRLLNEELEEKVRQRTYQMETLYNIVKDVSETFDLKEAMVIIAGYISKLVDFDIITQIITQEGLNHIHIEAPKGDEEVIREFFEKNKADFAKLNADVNNNRDDSTLVSKSDKIIKNISSTVFIPLIAEEKIVGIIALGAEEENAYIEEEIWFLYRIAENISHTLQRLKIILTAKEELETVLNHTSEGVLLLNSKKSIVLSNEAGKEFLDKISDSNSDKINLEILNLDELIEEGKKEIVLDDKSYVISIGKIKTDFVHGWLLTILDVTEERDLQKKILQQERLAIIGQLAGGIAHDFNNMLASIIGAADFALMSIENLESQELLNLIIRQGERGASLVKQMLDFTRQTVIRPKPVNLQSFLTEFSRVVRASLPASIALNASNNDSTVFMDQVQLQQLLMNLIFNSRDAMPQGGEISIIVNDAEHTDIRDFEKIDTLRKGKYVHIIIEDDGEGMNEKTLKRAFEPFFTTKSPGKGSGLGLSQVYGIVRQSKSYIDIESKKGKGTKVHLFIRKHYGTGIEEIEEEATPGFGRILLVEDDEDVREITKIMLENYGYEVVTAENGKKAFEMYNETFDLVLTDIVMPVMGGKELIQELQKIKPNVKCIAMTGYADVQVPSNIVVLHKPMTSSKLVNHVQRALDQLNGTKAKVSPQSKDKLTLNPPKEEAESD